MTSDFVFPRRPALLAALALTVVSAYASNAKPSDAPSTTPTPSPNTLYLCQDDGKSIYTNTQLNKRCKAFALGSLHQEKKPPQSSLATPAPTPASPPAFPKVSEVTQKARDADRKSILKEELASEQKQLDEARKELIKEENRLAREEKNYKIITEKLQPIREKIALHQRNIQALQKELSNTK